MGAPARLTARPPAAWTPAPICMDSAPLAESAGVCLDVVSLPSLTEGCFHLGSLTEARTRPRVALRISNPLLKRTPRPAPSWG